MAGKSGGDGGKLDLIRLEKFMQELHVNDTILPFSCTKFADLNLQSFLLLVGFQLFDQSTDNNQS